MNLSKNLKEIACSLTLHIPKLCLSCQFLESFNENLKYLKSYINTLYQLKKQQAKEYAQ